MKPFLKLALGTGLATIPFISGYTMAQDGRDGYVTNSSGETIVPGYVTNSSGEIVRTGFGECWRQPDWTPDKAVPECEGKVAEVVPPPERETEEVVAAEEHLTLDDSGEALFAFNKALLSSSSREKLDGLIERVRNFVSVDRVLVTGHTDRLGSDSYNMKLSRRRAESVRNYLLDSQVVDTNHIEVDARGESEPVVECEGARSKKLIACLAPNRRVQVDVTGIKSKSKSSN